MRTINLDDVGHGLIDLIDEVDPADEDIGIFDKQGNLRGVVLTKDAYEFFLRKAEEEEDRIDMDTVNEFLRSGEKEQ